MKDMVSYGMMNDENGSHCLLVVHEIQWKQVQQDHPQLADYNFDDYGRIPPNLKIRRSMKVMIEPHVIQPYPEIKEATPVKFRK